MKAMKRAKMIMIPTGMKIDQESRNRLAEISIAMEDAGEAMFILSDALGRIAHGDEPVNVQECSCTAEAAIDHRPSTPAACPFCGSTKVEVEPSASIDGYVGKCQVCRAKGPVHRSLAGATLFWNHRAGGLRDA